LKFKTIDITKDKFAANDCLKHGCKGVPVILIAGTYWICGFDEKKIVNALGK
jgi:glutaredoxin 3